MRGQTISITLPTAIVDNYDEKAKKLRTSRSKVISALLVAAYEEEQKKKQLLSKRLTKQSEV